MSTENTSAAPSTKLSTGERLRGLYALLTGYRLLYGSAAVSLTISSIAKTSSLLLLAYLVDNVLLNDNTGAGRSVAQTILLIAAGLIGLALVEGMFSFLSGRFAAQTAESITRKLRSRMFDHTQRLSFAFHDQAQTGDLIQRATSDISMIQRFFAEQATEIVRVILLFLVNFIAILFIDVRLAFLSAIVVPFIVVISVYFFRKVSVRYEAFQAQDARLSTTLQENLSGVRVVKAFARQPYETTKFEKENHSRFSKGKRLLQMHSIYWPITDTMCTLQMLAGFAVGALMVIDNQITPGQYVSYAGMVIYIIFPLRNLGRLVVQASTGLVSYDRIMEILREPLEPITDGAYILERENVRGEVVFDDVSFEYVEDKPALQNISFRAEPGEIIALMGSTGSGKTTLAALLPRFYDYTSGLLTIDGMDVKDITRDSLRRNIGIVEQEPFLFSRSIRDNVTYGVDRDVEDDEVYAAARAAAIHDVILEFPDGYNTIVGEKGVTLSGGQKQRVAIARTLLKNPRILILDDATSSVDMETEAGIRQALERLMRNRTTFIIAHRVQSVMTADQILVLDKGRVVQHGTHDELVMEPGFYQQIYDLQARIESELEKEIASV